MSKLKPATETRTRPKIKTLRQKNAISSRRSEEGSKLLITSQILKSAHSIIPLATQGGWVLISPRVWTNHKRVIKPGVINQLLLCRHWQQLIVRHCSACREHHRVQTIWSTGCCWPWRTRRIQSVSKHLSPFLSWRIIYALCTFKEVGGFAANCTILVLGDT